MSFGSRLRAHLPAAARPPLRAVRTAWRIASSPARALPSFLIIGAHKSGTTSLYAYLVAHPAVVPATVKEVHFFDDEWERGELFYRSCFPTRPRLARCRHEVGVKGITGEASPFYLIHPLVPERVRAMLPGARLNVLLRDPVERAISHHNQQVEEHFETLRLEEAIEREPERLRFEVDRVAGEPGYRSEALLRHGYLTKGRYAEQLERWFACFDRGHFLILDSAELVDDARGTMARVHHFLGLPALELPAYDLINARDYPPPDAALVIRLQRYFAPHNARLYELLGRDFGWGKEDRYSAASTTTLG